VTSEGSELLTWREPAAVDPRMSGEIAATDPGMGIETYPPERT